MTRSTAIQALVYMTGFLGLQQHAIVSVQGHVLLIEPVSRTYYYTDVFDAVSPNETEYCPHCMQSNGPAAVRARAARLTDPEVLAEYGGGEWPNLSVYEKGEMADNGNYIEPEAISVRHGICGDPGQGRDDSDNRYGQENSVYPVLDSYEEGSILETKVVISTYHWGHFEFFICNAADLEEGPDATVTQGCFNKHPLDRAEDDGEASRIDPKHRGRYYADPMCRADETDQTKPEGTIDGYVVTGRYQLPEGLTCDRCILQMVYYTGNTCKHPGYDDFDPGSWPSGCAPLTGDWIATYVSPCGDGSYPEEFWNCADIKIGGDTSESSANPAPAPTSNTPTSPPVDELTSPSPISDSVATLESTSASTSEPVNNTPSQSDDSTQGEYPPASDDSTQGYKGSSCAANRG